MGEGSVPEGFWWNWGATVAQSIVTLLAVLVALFGEWARTRIPFLQPKLSIDLKDSVGTLSGFGEPREPARYYYLRVYSPRRWPKPTETQVFVVRIEARKPNGLYQTIWTGEVPLRWMHQEIKSLTQTISREMEADFLCVTKSGQLQLMLLLYPNNMEPSYTGTTNLIVTVRAHAKECSSGELPVAIDWDGGWNDGNDEMTNHLAVRVKTINAS
jgi:hypothetical protein